MTAALRENKNLWPTAIDEFLRIESPIPFTARVCTRSAHLDGQTIKSGDVVITWLSIANRDPAVFHDPGTVDVARIANPMLAFGAGTHVCLAASFARTVGHIALETALTRLSKVRLLDETPEWQDRLVPHGLARLPLSTE